MLHHKYLNKTWFFLIIFIEGYVVLSTELIAFRQLIPSVGTGTEIASIIIGAVLLPMAAGYFYGGKNANNLSNRRQLINNFILAFFFLGFALTYVAVENFFFLLKSISIENKIIQTFLYCIIFLALPIFLLSQTIPLLIKYFKHTNHSLSTGYTLFFSTIGSFLGSIFSTLVLMTLIGVNNTVIFTLSLLLIVIISLSKKVWEFPIVLTMMFFSLMVYLNSNYFMNSIGIISNNTYNTISIIENNKDKSRILNMNNSLGSMYSEDSKHRFPYISYIEDNFITPLHSGTQGVKKILIIGAGGFTLGIKDKMNEYDFIDIDPELKVLAEKYFLKEKLGKNKNFIVDSATSYITHSHNKYDLIIVDAYANMKSIPMELTTIEFWKGIKSLLKTNAILVVNLISKPNFTDKFSVRFNNTFKTIFPTYSRQIIGNFNPWVATKDFNVIYTHFANEFNEDKGYYSNNKNSWFLDR